MLGEAFLRAVAYNRALLIYEKDLAPAGDKYAQYMVGYMNLTGKSVPVDRALALARYKLAAERDHAALVQARDALANILTEEEIARSNELFVEMWVTFGDNRLILDLIHEDLKNLRVKTGSRIPGSSTGSLTIVAGNGVGDDYYDKLRLRIEKRLEYLESSVGIIDIGIDEEVAEIKALEMDMRAELAALDGS